MSPAFRRRILFHHSSEFSHPRPLLSIVSPSPCTSSVFFPPPVFSRFITPFSRTVLFSCPHCFAVPFRTFLSSYICASSMVHPPSDHICPKKHLRPTGIMFVRTYARACVRTPRWKILFTPYLVLELLPSAEISCVYVTSINDGTQILTFLELTTLAIFRILDFPVGI